MRDFHRKFPDKLKRLIKKEKIDLIVSLRDYSPFSHRKLWFGLNIVMERKLNYERLLGRKDIIN